MASSSVKTLLVLVAAVGLTAAFTYLIVSNHYQRERLERLTEHLARIEAAKASLEEELAAAQARLRVRYTLAQTPPPSAATTNSPRLAGPPPSVPSLALAERSRVGESDKTTAGLGGASLTQLVAVLAPSPGAEWTRYVAGTGSVCLIEGETVAGEGDARTWKIEGRIIAGYFELDARFDFNQPASAMSRLIGSNLAARAEVMIPIRSLKSQAAVGATLMDRGMQQAFNAHSFPNIHYRLTSLTLAQAPENLRHPWRFSSRGEFSMNGVTNDCQWDGIIGPIGPDRLELSAMQPIQMTAFNIVPPSQTLAGMTLRAKDWVTVHVTWRLVRENPATAAR